MSVIVLYNNIVVVDDNTSTVFIPANATTFRQPVIL